MRMLTLLLTALLLAAAVVPTLAAKSKLCRDAITGKYVTQAYAAKHSATTVCMKSK